MKSTNTDTMNVRTGEELDQVTLLQYLQANLPDDAKAGQSITISQFPGGHSNLTYLITIGENEFVLRRPPVGPVAPTAHDMPREFRMLSAINPVFNLAPKPYLLCEDTSVIGVPFYLMERRKGIVIRRDLPPEFDQDIGLRRRISESMVDALAAMHNINLEQNNLTHLGKPIGFVARQVKGWSERWLRAKTKEVAEMDNLVEWLNTKMPSEPSRHSLLHNDYKLDNVMLSEDDPSKLVAILDWEMCALGDPLVDLGILLGYWSQKGDSEARCETISSVTTQAGWMSRAEIVDRYAALTGFDVTNIAYYEILALFKLTVVCQQIYFRYHNGQTKDERFAAFGERTVGLAQTAWALTHSGSTPEYLTLNLAGRTHDKA